MNAARCPRTDPAYGRCLLDADHEPATVHAFEGVDGPPGPPQRWQTPTPPAAADGPLEFVRARLDEDEATALDLIGINQHAAMLNGEDPIPWVPDVTDGRLMIRDERPFSRHSTAPGHVRVGHTWQSEAEHIARHDPARVLRRVATMRAALATIETAQEEAGPDYGYAPADRALDALPRLFAAEWADHPDYRQEWAA